MIRVMLVDDHASFRDALAFMIGREPDVDVVAQAGSVAGSEAVLPGVDVDVVLVDLDLPDGHGLDLLPAIRRRNPEAAAIVLTGSMRPESQALAIAGGAVGYLHKSTEVAEILLAIRTVASGQALITPMAAMALMHEAFAYQTRIQSTQRTLAQLTPRERDVLAALTDGLDNQAIAARLHMGTETVRSHVVQVLRKLGVESRLQAALFAVRHGVIDPDGRA